MGCLLNSQNTQWKKTLAAEKIGVVHSAYAYIYVVVHREHFGEKTRPTFVNVSYIFRCEHRVYLFFVKPIPTILADLNTGVGVGHILVERFGHTPDTYG